MATSVWSFGTGAAQPVPVEEIGQFATDQAYVVQAPGDEPGARQRLYVWSGNAASKDASEAAAAHAAGLDGSAEAALLHQVEGEESPEFVKLFAQFRISQGAAAKFEEEDGKGSPKKSKKDKKKDKKKEKKAAEAAAAAPASAPAAAPTEPDPAAPAAVEPAAAAPATAEEPAAPAEEAPAAPAEEAPAAVAEEKPAEAAPAETAAPESPAKPAAAASAEVAEEQVTPTKAKELLKQRMSGAMSSPMTQKQQQEGSTYALHSAKAWAGGAAAEPAPAVEVKIKPGEQSFGYEELKGMRGESGIDMTRKEAYLSDADFEKVFGKARADFKALPAWRQQQAKKQVGLW